MTKNICLYKQEYQKYNWIQDGLEKFKKNLLQKKLKYKKVVEEKKNYTDVFTLTISYLTFLLTSFLTSF